MKQVLNTQQTDLFRAARTGENITFTNGNDGATRMSIDSSGRVTTPNQPSFHVQMNSNQTGYNASTSSGTQDYIQYDTEVYDTGNNIASDFTAPVQEFIFLEQRLIVRGYQSKLVSCKWWESVRNRHSIYIRYIFSSQHCTYKIISK